MDTKKVFSNFIWRFFDRCGSQIISLVVSIILARILEPEEFGLIALVIVLITIMQVFIDSGLGNALIQKKNTDELDFSTVFYFNMFVCGVLYLAIWICSPYIAHFYDMKELTSVIRVMSIVLIVSGLRNVQQAYVSRNLLFKKYFFSTIGGTAISACVGISMALCGYGIWALVFQNLTNNIISTMILWFTIKWRPRAVFSIIRLKELFCFGWKLLVSALIDTVYKNIRQLIIGKIYTADDLAYYNRGEQFPLLIVSNINTSIDSVLFPTMSAEQDDIERVKSMTRRAIKTSTYIMMPMMVGLAVCAEPIVSIMLTDKWLPCVPYMRIFCFSYAFFPVHTANLNAIMAMGRSDIYLKLEIIKKTIGIIALLLTMKISVMAMAWSLLAVTVASQLINSWPNRKLLKYSYYNQIIDMAPQIVLSICMGIIVYAIGTIEATSALSLTIQILVGITVYILGSIIFKIDSFQYVKSIIKTLLNRS